MSRLQNHLFGPYLSSFSTNSDGYWLSNEPKSDLKQPIFRFGPNSPTVSQGALALADLKEKSGLVWIDDRLFL